MKTKQLLLCALFAALTAIGSLVKIPLPGMTMPITLQVFFMIMAGLLLEPKYALVSQLVYMAIGLLGLPVFSGGGGISYILMPSFGYIPGFALCAMLLSILVRNKLVSFNRGQGSKFKKIILIIILAIVSLASMYVLGVVYMYVIFNFYMGKPQSLGYIIMTYNAVFFIIDLVKLAIAIPVCTAILRRMPVSYSSPKKTESV